MRIGTAGTIIHSYNMTVTTLPNKELCFPPSLIWLPTRNPKSSTVIRASVREKADCEGSWYVSQAEGCGSVRIQRRLWYLPVVAALVPEPPKRYQINLQSLVTARRDMSRR
jgi:hypothetical protein